MRVALLSSLLLVSACSAWGEDRFPCEVTGTCAVPIDAGKQDGSAPDASFADAQISEVGNDADAAPLDVLADVEASLAEASAEAEASQCDPLASPDGAPCTIDDSYGVFVSTSATDAGSDGTKSRPFSSISIALQRAKIEGKRVYICDDGAGYAEQIAIGVALDGLHVFGGFECDTWTYSTSRRAKVKAPFSPAVAISKLTIGLTLADLEIVAPDATAPGGSSFAVVVHESANVAFRRVKAVAGKGRDGAHGENGGSNNAPLPVAPSGNSGVNACSDDPRGGRAVVSACGGVDASNGGRGGDGAIGLAGIGASGESGTPVRSGGVGGVGESELDGQTWSCTIGGGDDGANGVAGVAGASAVGLGALSLVGWTGVAGADGAPGAPGQGGGGGGGARAPIACTLADGGVVVATGASGGGGGGGGCGGLGGKGGGAGGSSIAIVSVNSSLTLDACDLVASDAGNGGNGGNGQAGASGGRGGAAGAGAASSDACEGGKGGQGGTGGPGGAGAGGHSLGVAYRGAAPVGLDLIASQLGAKGIGGKPGSGATGTGEDGKAAQAHLF